MSEIQDVGKFSLLSNLSAIPRAISRFLVGGTVGPLLPTDWKISILKSHIYHFSEERSWGLNQLLTLRLSNLGSQPPSERRNAMSESSVTKIRVIFQAHLGKVAQQEKDTMVEAIVAKLKASDPNDILKNLERIKEALGDELVEKALFHAESIAVRQKIATLISEPPSLEGKLDRIRLLRGALGDTLTKRLLTDEAVQPVQNDIAARITSGIMGPSLEGVLVKLDLMSQALGASLSEEWLFSDGFKGVREIFGDFESTLFVKEQIISLEKMLENLSVIETKLGKQLTAKLLSCAEFKDVRASISSLSGLGSLNFQGGVKETLFQAVATEMNSMKSLNDMLRRLGVMQQTLGEKLFAELLTSKTFDGVKEKLALYMATDIGQASSLDEAVGKLNSKKQFFGEDLMAELVNRQEFFDSVKGKLALDMDSMVGQCGPKILFEGSGIENKLILDLLRRSLGDDRFSAIAPAIYEHVNSENTDVRFYLLAFRKDLSREDVFIETFKNQVEMVKKNPSSEIALLMAFNGLNDQLLGSKATKPNERIDQARGMAKKLVSVVPEQFKLVKYFFKDLQDATQGCPVFIDACKRHVESLSKKSENISQNPDSEETTDIQSEIGQLKFIVEEFWGSGEAKKIENKVL